MCARDSYLLTTQKITLFALVWKIIGISCFNGITATKSFKKLRAYFQRQPEYLFAPVNYDNFDKLKEIACENIHVAIKDKPKTIQFTYSSIKLNIIDAFQYEAHPISKKTIFFFPKKTSKCGRKKDARQRNR